MTEQNSAIELMKMPERLKAVLGPPPVLKHEDPVAYESLLNRQQYRRHPEL